MEINTGIRCQRKHCLWAGVMLGAGTKRDSYCPTLPGVSVRPTPDFSRPSANGSGRGKGTPKFRGAERGRERKRGQGEGGTERRQLASWGEEEVGSSSLAGEPTGSFLSRAAIGALGSSPALREGMEGTAGSPTAAPEAQGDLRFLLPASAGKQHQPHWNIPEH